MCVGNLFKTLPVRRRELERNFKRDYSKVLNLLQAYASICVGVKFSVFNQPPKGCAAFLDIHTLRGLTVGCEEREPLRLLPRGIPPPGKTFRMCLDPKLSLRWCR